MLQVSLSLHHSLPEKETKHIHASVADILNGANADISKTKG